MRACEDGLDLREAAVHLRARRLAVGGLARRGLLQDVRVDAFAQGEQRRVLRAPLAALLLLEQLLDLVRGSLLGQLVGRWYVSVSVYQCAGR